MAYQCASVDCPPVIYLSASGGYTFNGILLGDATHDNARLVRENAPTVAAFSNGGGPPSDPPDSWGLCFSGGMQVIVEGRGPVRMDQLKVGDSILSSLDGRYSKVYSFGHRDGNGTANFLQIYTESAKPTAPLEITRDHMLYVTSKGDAEAMNQKRRLLPAGQVQIGDLLWTSAEHRGSAARVTKVNVVQRFGVFAPFTTTGDIVVNGMLASNFIALSPALQSRLSFALQHSLQHGAYTPYRLYCMTVGDCEHESRDEETGYSRGTTVWLSLLRWLEALDVSPSMVTVFLYVVAIPGHWAMLILERAIGLLLSSQIAAFLFAIWIFKRQTTVVVPGPSRPHCHAA